MDKLEVDAAKGTLTVTGDCDPYEIIVRTRKKCKYAEVVSIGPPPKPQEKEKKTEKKPEKKVEPYHMPYPQPCQGWGIVRVDPCYDHNPSCSIM